MLIIWNKFWEGSELVVGGKKRCDKATVPKRWDNKIVIKLATEIEINKWRVSEEDWTSSATIWQIQ